MAEEIIIDGVDVSKCGHYHYGKCEIDYDEWNNEIIRYNECQNNPNCYFKQLKRKEQEVQQAMDNYVQLDLQRVKEYNELVDLYKAKEQECEELHSRTASIIYSLTGGRLSYSTYSLEGCEDAYRDQLEIDVKKATRELEEENKTLKQELSELFNCLKQANGKRNAYKQTLTEIKEIAEIEIECKTYEIENDCFNKTRCKALNEHIDFIKQILQKISECEVEMKTKQEITKELEQATEYYNK